jgi:hypothetical protein
MSFGVGRAGGVGGVGVAVSGARPLAAAAVRARSVIG